MQRMQFRQQPRNPHNPHDLQIIGNSNLSQKILNQYSDWNIECVCICQRKFPINTHIAVFLLSLEFVLICICQTKFSINTQIEGTLVIFVVFVCMQTVQTTKCFGALCRIRLIHGLRIDILLCTFKVVSEFWIPFKTKNIYFHPIQFFEVKRFKCKLDRK